jgi:tRNA/rRNA methyltransferase
MQSALQAHFKTRFILINPSHAGNVGAAARAMKVMGFDDLVLVAPRWANVLRREETIQRASGALDVLGQARIVETLDDALDGMTHLCATAMTPRDFGPPTASPREHFASVLPNMLQNIEQTIESGSGKKSFSTPNGDGDGDGVAAPQTQGIAFLFGSERFGMRNEDVYRCHVCLSIPSNPQFGSLNISAALQVIAYEWRLALGGFALAATVTNVAGKSDKADAADLTHLAHSGEPSTSQAVPAGNLADAQQVAGMLAHLEQSLVAIGFLDPAAPKKLMPRLNQLFNRAAVTQEEIHILRGVAKSMIALAARPKD